MSKSPFEILQPQHWTTPRGYANGIVAQGRQVFIAGQVGWNAQAQFETDDFVAQVDLALSNVVDVLRTAGGGARRFVGLTWCGDGQAGDVARRKGEGTGDCRGVGGRVRGVRMMV